MRRMIMIHQLAGHESTVPTKSSVSEPLHLLSLKSQRLMKTREIIRIALLLLHNRIFCFLRYILIGALITI